MDENLAEEGLERNLEKNELPVGEGEERFPEKILECPLRVELISRSLGLLLKSLFGEGYMYTKVELSNQKLTDIDSLKWYRFLFYVNISKNYIENIDALEDMAYLLTLDASYNKIKDIKVINCSEFLSEINLERNQIEVLPLINIHYLKILNLNHNKIASLTDEDGKFLINGNFLTRLELRSNLLTTTFGIYLPRLTHLYMAGNKIETITDFSDLRFLEILHLRDNKIETLEGITDNVASLSYINLRNNKISAAQEIKKVVKLQALAHLVLRENPIEEDEDYRILVLRCIPHLIRLDKDEYEDEDRELIKEELPADVPEEGLLDE